MWRFAFFPQSDKTPMMKWEKNETYIRLVEKSITVTICFCSAALPQCVYAIMLEQIDPPPLLEFYLNQLKKGLYSPHNLNIEHLCWQK